MKHKYSYLGFLLFFFGASINLISQKPDYDLRVATYLGDEQRNYYGDEAPSKLDTIWRIYLGEGISPAYGNPNKLWKGAGWTGQPLVVEEYGHTYLIQGAFDYNLKKIDAVDGRIIWQYKFDDIIKGTGTIWHNRNAKSPEEEYVIIQGSRRGVKNSLDSKYCESLRGISYLSGKELWRMNVKRTRSYSRDVDGSAIIVKDTGYLALENGLFTVFDPDPQKVEMRDGMLQPKIYKEIPFFEMNDTVIHGSNIESESSPCLLNGRIYTTAGSGRVYGYNTNKGEVDWVFEIGADLNGSPTVTYDNCLLIPVEKQYIDGKGGVFKLDPSRSPDSCVVWYFPVEDSTWFHWEGGIIGSIGVNDRYVQPDGIHYAAFIGVDGNLYVVDHENMIDGMNAIGPDNKTTYLMPVPVLTEPIGGSISTPIIVGNKLIAPLDKGLYLYEYDEIGKFQLLDVIEDIRIDATPVCYNGRLYVASLDGYLYCFGEK
ncbi:MAG: hypothetical protein JXB49_20650 [Bacteroidales bacterium]|nr:hypothetical protein [Bacteroidales bacterium]